MWVFPIYEIRYIWRMNKHSANIWRMVLSKHYTIPYLCDCLSLSLRPNYQIKLHKGDKIKVTPVSRTLRSFPLHSFILNLTYSPSNKHLFSGDPSILFTPLGTRTSLFSPTNTRHLISDSVVFTASSKNPQISGDLEILFKPLGSSRITFPLRSASLSFLNVA
jgi:hypothetical protein